MSGKRKTPEAQAPAGEDAKPKAQQPAISADYFRAVWNGGLTLRDVAERLGLAASTCSNYATRLRRAGHYLKEFQRGRPKILDI